MQDLGYKKWRDEELLDVLCDRRSSSASTYSDKNRFDACKSIADATRDRYLPELKKRNDVIKEFMELIGTCICGECEECALFVRAKELLK